MRQTFSPPAKAPGCALPGRHCLQVQFTPGAGTPSAVACLPMFHMLQEYRVPLFIECPLKEVEQVATALDPRGVALRVGGLGDATAGESLIEWRDGKF